MKILYVTSFAELYGANMSLLNLIDGALSRGHQVAVIVQGKGTLSEELDKKNVEHMVIPFYNETGKGIKGFIKGVIKLPINWAFLFYNFKRIRNFQADIIHSNSSVPLFGAYLSFFFKIPHVWHIREFLWEDYKIKYSFGKKYFNFWLKKAVAAVCISKAIYYARLNGVSIQKEIIYNGIIYQDKILDGKKLFIKKIGEKEKFTIAIVGAVVPGKNQLDGVKAFKSISKKFPNIMLYIIGKGSSSYTKSISDFIEKEKISDKVVLTGHVNNTMDYYNKMDLLLMCSRNEGLGRVTIEAMSRGVTVIGYDNAGTSEIIQDGINGLLYKGNHIELAKRIEELYLNQELNYLLSKEALKTVRKKFLVEDYAEKIDALYKTII